MLFQHKDELDHEETLVNKLFREIIGPFILDKTTQVLNLKCIFFNLSFSYVHCCCTYFYHIVCNWSSLNQRRSRSKITRTRVILSVKILLIDETFWQEGGNFFQNLRNHFEWYSGLQLQIVVNNPPDFFNPKIRETFEQMLDGKLIINQDVSHEHY